MTTATVLVGPATVRGPCPVRSELARAAVTFLDDRETVLGDRRVAVDTVLGEVIATVAGEHPRAAGAVMLVCPGWWPSAWQDRIRAAAVTMFAEAVVVQRPELYRRMRPDVDVVVEIADEFVVAGTGRSMLFVASRRAGVVDAVVAGLGEPTSTLIDVPGGVRGARTIATQIAARLRRTGEVEIVGDPLLLRAVREMSAPPAPRPGRRVRWVAAALLLTTATAGAALHREIPNPSTVLITEGRVSASVPVGWAVERITAGRGSRRVQVAEPGGERAVLIVQSPAEADMAATAATLASALQRENPLVFADLQTAAQRGGRPVVSYTETRAGRQVDWAVFLDDGMRIAIGCQSPPGQPMREICDQTIASAHAVR